MSEPSPPAEEPPPPPPNQSQTGWTAANPQPAPVQSQASSVLTAAPPVRPQPVSHSGSQPVWDCALGHGGHIWPECRSEDVRVLSCERCCQMCIDPKDPMYGKQWAGATVLRKHVATHLHGSNYRVISEGSGGRISRGQKAALEKGEIYNPRTKKSRDFVAIASDDEENVVETHVSSRRESVVSSGSGRRALPSSRESGSSSRRRRARSPSISPTPTSRGATRATKAPAKKKKKVTPGQGGNNCAPSAGPKKGPNGGPPGGQTGSDPVINTSALGGRARNQPVRYGQAN